MSDEIEKTIKPTEQNVKPSRPCPWRRVGLFVLIAAILAVAAGGYFAYTSLLKSHSQLAAEVAALQKAQQSNDAAELQKNVSTALESTQQLQDDVKNLQKTVAELTQTEHVGKSTLEIAQANYYVKLANENLQYANNVPLAITLLKMADDTIHRLDDPKLDTARKALAEDIANLQGIPQVDVTGIYMRLAALNNQLDKLQLPNKALNVDTQAATVETAPSQSWWQRGLHTTWQALQKIVVVRYHEKGALPLVAPDQQMYLYQNLHAMIAQSTWGLLHGQQAIYQTSLQQTAEWVKQYFLADSAVTQAVLAELNQLQQVNIHPANPTINSSTQAFAALMQNNQ